MTYPPKLTEVELFTMVNQWQINLQTKELHLLTEKGSPRCYYA